MNDETRLTLAYIEHAPAAAARVLQTLKEVQAAAFLESVPARFAAPVIDQMIPWQAARYLELLSASHAASIVRQLPFNDGASLARLMRAADRERMFESLPANQARRLRNALNYPPHQVGAWLDPEVPVLKTTDNVQDALRVLRAAEAVSHVFLESADDSVFAGAVRVQDALRGAASMQLDQLPIVRIAPISNRATISSVTFDERWDEFLHLPVVGRRGNVLGGLSRKTQRAGMHEQYSRTEPRQWSLPQHLLEAYLVTCSGVARVLARSIGALPPQRRRP